jgi:hypothetical protein
VVAASVIAAEVINIVLGVVFGMLLAFGIARGVVGWLTSRAKDDEDEE